MTSEMVIQILINQAMLSMWEWSILTNNNNNNNGLAKNSTCPVKAQPYLRSGYKHCLLKDKTRQLQY